MANRPENRAEGRTGGWLVGWLGGRAVNERTAVLSLSAKRAGSAGRATWRSVHHRTAPAGQAPKRAAGRIAPVRPHTPEGGLSGDLAPVGGTGSDTDAPLRTSGRSAPDAERQTQQGTPGQHRSGLRAAASRPHPPGSPDATARPTALSPNRAPDHPAGRTINHPDRPIERSTARPPARPPPEARLSNRSTPARPAPTGTDRPDRPSALPTAEPSDLPTAGPSDLPTFRPSARQPDRPTDRRTV